LACPFFAAKSNPMLSLKLPFSAFLLRGSLVAALCLGFDTYGRLGSAGYGVYSATYGYYSELRGQFLVLTTSVRQHILWAWRASIASSLRVRCIT
jgi:hypothetical protein